MPSSMFSRIAGALFLALLGFVFAKNFWINEDAYILFRSLEQLSAGNGAVWNAGERVQVYTSVMWYWLLAAVNALLGNVFISTVTVSFLLFVGLLLVLRRGFANGPVLYFLFVCMVLSKGFFDYTASGLENILAYVVIATLYLGCWRISFSPHDPDARRSALKVAALVGMMPLARHDLVLIGAPPFMWLLWCSRSNPRLVAILLATAGLPILLWTLGSLAYYGVPLPNTAYAKLSHGFSSAGTLDAGVNYFFQNLRKDPLTVLVIVASPLFVAVFGGGARQWSFVAGVVVYCLYLCNAGGDYMQGRFLSFPFLVSLLMVGECMQGHFRSRPPGAIVLAVIAFYPVLVAATPLMTPWTYGRDVDGETLLLESRTTGLLDQRPLHYSTTLAAWWLNETRHPGVLENFRLEGETLRQASDKVSLKGAVGCTGYYAGLEVHIVDMFALTDPLLSHLPARLRWLSGHFMRENPQGYLQRLQDGTSPLQDEKLARYYEVVELLTRSEELFSERRLKAIVAFNTGQYEHLLADYRHAVSQQRADLNKVPIGVSE